MRKNSALKFILATSTILVLAGCSNSAPNPTPTQNVSPETTKTATPKPSSTPTPTETVTPTPEPEPIKTTVITIGADSLKIGNLKGEIKQEFPYETTQSAVPAIAALTELYGKEPIIEYSGDDVCWYQMNTYNWDNMAIAFPTPTKNPNDANWFTARTVQPNGNYERVVQAPNGAQIGFSFQEYRQKNPELPFNDGFTPEDTFKKMLAEVSSKSSSNPEEIEGTLIVSDNDKIEFIGAPNFLNENC